MRVVFLTTRFSTGGAELNAVMLAHKFKEMGIESELWSLYKVGDLDTSGVRSVVMLEKTPSNPLDFFKILKNFIFNIRRFEPDVGVGFQPLANIIGSILFKFRGRFIASQRNPSFSQRKVIKFLEMIVGSTGLYYANICVSNDVLKTYLGYPEPYKNKLSVIHNGLPPLPYMNWSKEKYRRHFGLGEEDKIIGFVGRLHEQKNPFFLMDVIRRIPDYRLVVVGDGPLENELKRYVSDIEDRVLFLGRLEREDLAIAYSCFDVLAFPSIYEGFGRTLIEAMSFGVPVIANDIPITREVMGSAGTYAKLDVDIWVQEILNLQSGFDKDILKNRSSLFSLDKMVSSYLNVASGQEAKNG